MAYPRNIYTSFARGQRSGNVPKAKHAMGHVGLGAFVPKAPAAPKPLSADMTPFVPQTGPAVLPPDPAYQATMAALQQQQQNTGTSLEQQRKAGLSAYGYTENGSGGVAFDANNPYSQAALLRKHYQQAKTGNLNSLAERGQGYAGSLQNAQDSAFTNFDQSDKSLTAAVQAFLANNTSAQNAAQSQYELNAAGALGQSVQNATSQLPENANAVTAGANGQALVPQSQNSRVVLASGWTVVYDANGNAIRFIPPA